MHNVIPALMGTRHLGGTAVAQLPKAVLQKSVASVAMLVACPILIVVSHFKIEHAYQIFGTSPSRTNTRISL